MEEIDSPFARDGHAFIARAPGDERENLVWDIEGVTPGKPYSVSFFFQNRMVKDPRELEVFWFNIVDGNESVYNQRFYPRNYPQFFSTTVVFGTEQAQVRLRIAPGSEIIFGEFGRAVEVDDLTEVRSPHSSELWSPKLSLPQVYRGLRDFEIEVKVWAGEEGTLAALNQVEVRAGMNIAAAKLPRLLPGKNTLHVLCDAAGSSAKLTAEITPRGVPGRSVISVEHNALIPADGATFGRVLITAADANGELISGGFYRLRPPAEVTAHPYVRAISDWQKLQTTREFHLTSLVPGTYPIGVEQWNGTAWQETNESFEVTFEAVPSPATDFLRSDYARSWLQPRAGDSPDGSTDRLELSWPDGPGADVIDFDIGSVLSPRVEWTLQGPVKGLGMHTNFQPNSRTLRETAETLRALTTSASDSPARDYALAVEEYVALTVEGVLPEAYYFSDYPSFGRLHREGRGWCNQYSTAVHALLVEGGLESRLRNLPDHVTGEVRGDGLETMLVDAMLQVAVTDTLGNRVMLDRLNEEDFRIIGAGVDNETRRGKFSGYLHSPMPVNRPWMKRDPSDTKYRNAVLDDKIFSVDLHAWETLSWSSGSVPDIEIHTSRGVCAENQTILTQLAKIEFPEFANDPAITISKLALDSTGNLAPTGSSWGQIRFPFRTPIEIDDLLITTKGVLGGGGRIAITMRPILATPLIEGVDGFKVL